MAVNKKGSRKIVVDDVEFRWRATGSDNSITLIVWPEAKDNSKIVGNVKYHHDWQQIEKGHFSSNSQLIVTNRMVREVILSVGVQKALNNHGQINIGDIEEIYDVKNAVRSPCKNGI